MLQTNRIFMEPTGQKPLAPTATPASTVTPLDCTRTDLGVREQKDCEADKTMRDKLAETFKKYVPRSVYDAMVAKLNAKTIEYDAKVLESGNQGAALDTAKANSQDQCKATVRLFDKTMTDDVLAAKCANGMIEDVRKELIQKPLQDQCKATIRFFDKNMKDKALATKCANGITDDIRKELIQKPLQDQCKAVVRLFDKTMTEDALVTVCANGITDDVRKEELQRALQEQCKSMVRVFDKAMKEDVLATTCANGITAAISAMSSDQLQKLLEAEYKRASARAVELFHEGLIASEPKESV